MDMGAHHEKNGGKMRSLSCCSSENCISWTVTICICSSKNEKKWPKNVFPLHFLATTILMLLYFRWNPVPMRTIPTAFVHPFASQEREFSPCTKCFSLFPLPSYWPLALQSAAKWVAAKSQPSWRSDVFHAFKWIYSLRGSVDLMRILAKNLVFSET